MLMSLLLGAGCLAPATLREQSGTAALEAARLQASEAAPALPIYVLRLAHDELSLSVADRAAVAMIIDDAEFHARTLDRSRAAFLEVLARGVDAGSMNENVLPIYTDQISWASGMVGPYLAYALGQLHDLLPPEQRVQLVAITKQHYPLWARAWAASSEPPRWVDGFARRDFTDLVPDLIGAGQRWAERSAAHVRTVLPTLEPAQRAALARSLRFGTVE